jgi:hypothetical protein
VNVPHFKVWKDGDHIEMMLPNDIIYLVADGVKVDCVVGALEDELVRLLD